MMARHFDLQETANTAIVMFVVGLVFTIIGNYLPKAPAGMIIAIISTWKSAKNTK